MAVFDNKTFNPEVFGKYVETFTDLRRNELIKAGVFRVRNDLKPRFADQAGGNYFVEPISAPVGGDALNYDGSTDITGTSRGTVSQGKIVIGRAKAFTERDFSADITGVKNAFLPVAGEVAHYWDNENQETLLSILKGIFSMTGVKNLEFVNNHTYDISGATANKVDATSLNSAIQKACGDNKSIFTVAIMHSTVATNLENQNLLNYMKYTDMNGVQRDLTLATWNGRLVLVDDNMPVIGIYTVSQDTQVVAGKTYYTLSGNAYTPVSNPSGNPSTSSYYELTGANYTTYLLGRGAFDYVDVGAAVPYEMGRDASKNGGETTLYTRERKLFAPRGISFEPASIPVSPTAAQLEAGASWAIAHDGNPSHSIYYPHKAIPIARIISRG